METLERRLEQNTQKMLNALAVLRERFPMESAVTLQFCAVCAALQPTDFSIEEMLQARQRIRQNTLSAGKISADRQLLMAASLGSTQDPQQCLQMTLESYRTLHEEYHFSGAYLLPASLWLALSGHAAGGVWSAEKASELFQLMLARHPCLVQGEGDAFALLLACCDGTPRQLAEQVERFHMVWKKRIFSPLVALSISNAMAALQSSIFVIPENWEEKITFDKVGRQSALRMLLDFAQGYSAQEKESVLQKTEKALSTDRTLRSLFARKQRSQIAAALCVGTLLQEKPLEQRDPACKVSFAIAMLEVAVGAAAGAL